jgi:hypothetical protein
VKLGRGDGVRLKKKKKKKKSKVMPREMMGAFGNKHLLEMERVVGRPYFENVWAMSHTEVLLDTKHQHNFLFSHMIDSQQISWIKTHRIQRGKLLQAGSLIFGFL